VLETFDFSGAFSIQRGDQAAQIRGAVR